MRTPLKHPAQAHTTGPPTALPRPTSHPDQKTLTPWLRGLLSFAAFATLLSPKAVQAEEMRLALLVAHQRGWEGEPKLRYVLDGDLYPMAQTMQQLGFRVKVLTNPSAQTLRDIFKKTLSYIKRQPVSTFVFYYSGHADRKYFHLGKRSRHPLSYKEFLQFFKQVKSTRRIALFDSCYSGEIIRAFGSLRRYRTLLKKGQIKGVRAQRAFNLSKLSLPKQGDERGIRIISSSLGISWEVYRYRASVFTHHFLRGLKGLADMDKDGRITVDELFDFASRSVQQETGQRPEQLILTRRHTPYAFAPAYGARLHIGKKVVGQLKVSISNFVWSKHKTKNSPLKLAVIAGKGLVELKQKGRCWQQPVTIPRRGELQLSERWIAVSCQRFQRLSKGSIILPAQLHDALLHPPRWIAAFQGALLISSLAGSQSLVGGSLALHYTLPNHPFALGIRLGFWGTSIEFQQDSLTQLYPEVRLEAGLLLHKGPLHLFAGVSAGGGLLLQDINRQLLIGGVLRTSISVMSVFWFTQRLGLSLSADLGFSLLQRAKLWKTPLATAVQLGFATRF